MNYFQALILSIVEGVTEFLPISSTGHLILTSQIMGITNSEFVKSFEIVIQLGAILSIVFLYGKTLWQNRNLWLKLTIAFVPTGVVGVTVYKWVKSYLLGNSYIVVISLILGGIILVIWEKIYRQKKPIKYSELSIGHCLAIGLFQSLAIIPGVSRAAATIIGGLFVGLDRKRATEFSFLLAIPTMAAAVGLDLVKSAGNFSQNEIGLLVVGFIGAFLTAIVAVRWLVGFVEKHNFSLFGWYRIAIALAFCLVFLV